MSNFSWKATTTLNATGESMILLRDGKEVGRFVNHHEYHLWLCWEKREDPKTGKKLDV